MGNWLLCANNASIYIWMIIIIILTDRFIITWPTANISISQVVIESFTNLNTSLGQFQLHCQMFTRKYIRILALLERLLQLVQLIRGKCRTRSACNAGERMVYILYMRLLMGNFHTGANHLIEIITVESCAVAHSDRVRRCWHCRRFLRRRRPALRNRQARRAVDLCGKHVY